MIEHYSATSHYQNVLCSTYEKTPYKEALYPGARIRRQDTEQVSYLKWRISKLQEEEVLEEGGRDSGLAVPSTSEIYGPAPTGVGSQHLSKPYFPYRYRVVNLATTLQQTTTTSGVNLATPQFNKCGQLGDHTAFLVGHMPNIFLLQVLSFPLPFGQ